MAEPAAPGRSCPLDYRYGAGALAQSATLCADALWIAGGLYGNSFAFRSLEEMAHAERGETALVFNGDFHWFDVDDGNFAEIEKGVALHIATRGNVETEIAAPNADAGCGCAYPEWVDDGDVERSNRIIERLRRTARRAPGAAARLASLPMYRIAEVRGVRIAIVHGDDESLAGWNFSQEMLATAAGRRRAQDAFARAQARIFASSHTCLPVLREIGAAGVVVNNGSAGMPNFLGTDYGLATRIAAAPHADAIYGCRIDGLHVEAVPIRFDTRAWLKAFLAQWPDGSDAHCSYHRRIVHGPNYPLERARRAA